MSSKHPFRVMVDDIKAGAKQAAAEMKQAMGQPTDPDLSLYNRLSQSDFEAIRAQHGDEGLLEYIQSMESKRLQGGGHAG